MKFRLSPIAIAVLACHALPAVAQEPPDNLTAAPSAGAAPSPADATQLRAVTVQAELPSDYKVDAVASPKFTQPLRDTPQTIQVITHQVFTQQGATTLTEALRNSAGVGTFYAGENGNTSTGDAIYMRGFDTSSSIFVDGIRDLGSISRDVFNIDQVEVEKGAAGTDNGRSAPTGAINLVSKQAFLDNAVSGTISAGTDGQKRVSADLNQTLGGLPGSALRMNTVWQDSDVAGRDHIYEKRVGLAPSLGLGLNGDTRAYVNLLYMKQNNIPDGFVPTIGLPGWTPQAGMEELMGHPVDSSNFYGTQADHDDVTAKMATVRVEHDFSDNLKLSNITRWGSTQQDYLLTSFMSTSANVTCTTDAVTGATDLSSCTVARSITTLKDVDNKILTNQLNLRYDFATGVVRHSLSAGLELSREQQDARNFSTGGSRPAANLYDPDWSDVGSTLYWAHNGSGNHGQTDTQSAYLFDTVKFLNDRLLVTGGVRADHYKTQYNASNICNTAGTTGGSGRGIVYCGSAPLNSIVTTTDAQTKDTLFNWKLGVVYKPIEAGSVYVNYAISQEPPGGKNFQLSNSASSLDNPDLEPQKAKTYEIGSKWDLMDGALGLNFALFRTNVSNEINTLDLDDQGNPTQSGKKRVQGVELSAVGNITDHWSISAGYTHLNTKVKEGAPVAVDGSSNLTYTPNDAFTSWTTYRLPFGLTIGGGARYTAGLRRGTDSAVGTPDSTKSYTVYDAVASYVVNDHFTLRVNGYNLSDKHYVASINKSGYRYTPGGSRTVLFSGDFTF